MAAEHQAAAGVLVEPVGELGPPRQTEAQAVQELTDAEAALRAGVHGQARGLVQDQHQAVPIEQARGQRLGRDQGRLRAGRHWRSTGGARRRHKAGATLRDDGSLPPSGHPASYYVATANAMPEHAPLQGSLSADVAIVGGGYTGLSALLHLAERGYDAVLLEALRVGAGASGRNGGQLGSGQRLGQRRLERMYGLERAQALWQLAEDAKAAVKDRIARHAIACDLKPGILHAAHKPAHAGELQRDAEHLLRHYGYPRSPLPAPARGRRDARHDSAISAACSIAAAGHLHPLNYALGLARGGGRGGRADLRAQPRDPDRGRPAAAGPDRGRTTSGRAISCSR